MAEAEARSADPSLVEPVKERDLPRYYSVLFAPAAERQALFALYAYAAEAEKVTEIVSEPALGEIRLTWWRDSLREALGGSATGAPIVDHLAAALRAARLDGSALGALTEARQADLYSDPPENFSDLEGRLGETQSTLFQLAGLFLGGKAQDLAEPAGHAGIAYGVAHGLWRFALERARGSMLVPADLLEKSGLDATTALTAEAERLGPAIAELADFGEAHRQTALKAARSLGRNVLPAFLPLAAAGVLLRRIRRSPAGFAASPRRLPAAPLRCR